MLLHARKLIAFTLLAACASIMTLPTLAADTAPSIADLRVAGLRGLEKGDQAAASDAADRLLLHYANDRGAIRLAGDLYLRCGKINSAIKQFERYLDLVPEDRPELWQYGVALALANRYDEGRKLFELHRVANPNDVENAAWHFLCVAKIAGLKDAKKLILPAPDDRRVPMNEIRRLLIDGDEQRVWDAVNQLPEDSAARREATFYANLYLGLYADAQNNSTKAKRLVGEAAKVEQINYMTDVARVYLMEIEAEQ
ncbi:MAG: tetratricopeptide repeat protein [Planctomycetaceae bacterium]